jgi:hypothetical protein
MDKFDAIVSFKLGKKIRTVDDLIQLEKDLSEAVGCRPEEIETNLSLGDLPHISLEEAEAAIRKYVTNGRADEAVGQFQSMWCKGGMGNPDIGFVYSIINRYEKQEED